jgi:hypothetical protein
MKISDELLEKNPTNSSDKPRRTPRKVPTSSSKNFHEFVGKVPTNSSKKVLTNFSKM